MMSMGAVAAEMPAASFTVHMPFGIRR